MESKGKKGTRDGHVEHGGREMITAQLELGGEKERGAKMNGKCLCVFVFYDCSDFLDLQNISYLYLY